MRFNPPAWAKRAVGFGKVCAPGTDGVPAAEARVHQVARRPECPGIVDVVDQEFDVGRYPAGFVLELP